MNFMLPWLQHFCSSSYIDSNIYYMSGTLIERCSYLCQHDSVGCPRKLLPGKYKMANNFTFGFWEFLQIDLWDNCLLTKAKSLLIKQEWACCVLWPPTNPKLLCHELCPILISFPAIKNPPQTTYLWFQSWINIPCLTSLFQALKTLSSRGFSTVVNSNEFGFVE